MVLFLCLYWLHTSMFAWQQQKGTFEAFYLVMQTGLWVWLRVACTIVGNVLCISYVATSSPLFPSDDVLKVLGFHPCSIYSEFSSSQGLAGCPGIVEGQQHTGRTDRSTPRDWGSDLLPSNQHSTDHSSVPHPLWGPPYKNSVAKLVRVQERVRRVAGDRSTCPERTGRRNGTSSAWRRHGFRVTS